MAAFTTPLGFDYIMFCIKNLYSYHHIKRKEQNPGNEDEGHAKCVVNDGIRKYRTPHSVIRLPRLGVDQTIALQGCGQRFPYSTRTHDYLLHDLFLSVALSDKFCTCFRSIKHQPHNLKIRSNTNCTNNFKIRPSTG